MEYFINRSWLPVTVTHTFQLGVIARSKDTTGIPLTDVGIKDSVEA